MGGKSSNKTSSTSSTTSVTTGDYRTTDEGVIEGNISLAENKGTVHLTKTDYGAVNGALEAGTDYFESAAELGNSAISANKDIALYLGEQSGNYLDSSLEFAGDSFKLSLDTIDQNNQRSNQLVTDALDYTSAMIKVANQSEAANMTEKVIDALPKIIIIGGVIFVGVAVVKRTGK